MTEAPPPPPPPRRRRPVVPLTTAAAVVVAAALVGAGTTYLVMNQRIEDLERELADEPTPQEEPPAIDDPLDQLDEMLGEDGLESLGDLFGDGLGSGLSSDLVQCLTPESSGEGGISGDTLDAQVAAIEDLIAADRGFERDDYDIEFVTMDEVQRRAVEISSEELDREAAAVDSRVLAALGAVSPSTDLAEAQLQALDEGVAGFYNPETRELVIGSETMDGIGTLITSHELVHAMADSTFGLPNSAQIAENRGSDAGLAALSAVEGDASLYSQRFIAQHLAFDELLGLGLESLGAQPSSSDLPHFVQRDLEFPYLEGLAFTCSVFLEDGWDGVDATYDDPPRTTAQVLFPDRYRSGEDAVEVRTPSGPDGWERIESDEFGAADLLFLFEAPGDDTSRALSDPLERASAWAGGTVHAWDDGGDTAVAVVLADRGGATPLCDSVIDYYTAAFPSAAGVPESAESEPTTESAGGTETAFDGPDQDAVITCTGDEVALGVGPDLETARAAVS